MGNCSLPNLLYNLVKDISEEVLAEEELKPSHAARIDWCLRRGSKILHEDIVSALQEKLEKLEKLEINNAIIIN